MLAPRLMQANTHVVVPLLLHKGPNTDLLVHVINKPAPALNRTPSTLTYEPPLRHYPGLSKTPIRLDNLHHHLITTSSFFSPHCSTSSPHTYTTKNIPHPPTDLYIPVPSLATTPIFYNRKHTHTTTNPTHLFMLFHPPHDSPICTTTTPPSSPSQRATATAHVQY